MSSDLVLQSAVTVGKNLLQKIKEIDDRYEEGPEWEHNILNALRFCVAAEEGMTCAKAAVLAILERRWDDLSLHFRLEYNNQFSVLVYRETGLQPSTMDNYIRAADTFILKGKKPFGQIQVPVRDDYGKPLLEEDGRPKTQFVEFDPTQVPLSKLSLMRSAVEKEDMTPKRWTMLMDRGTTIEELRQELYKVDEPDVPAGMRFSLEGNILVVSEIGYEPLEIGELFYEMWEHDLGRRALKRIFSLLGLPYDEDILAKRYEENKNKVLGKLYEELNRESSTTEQHNAA